MKPFVELAGEYGVDGAMAVDPTLARERFAFYTNAEVSLAVPRHVRLMTGMLMAFINDEKAHRSERTGKRCVNSFLAIHP